MTCGRLQEGSSRSDRRLHLLMRVLPWISRAVLLAVASTAGARGAAARDRTTVPLADRIARVVSTAGVKAGKLGVLVLSLDDGGVVFEKDADLALVPASTAKLATAAAVLDLLGPGHVFATTLSVRGEAIDEGGVVEGDLVLHGSGDPSLSKRDHESDPLWPLSTLAAQAAARGVTAVTGALVLDDGAFDRTFLHPSWPASDLDDWYGAPVAGLTFNDSCVTVLVRGGASSGTSASVLVPSTSGPWPLVCAVSTSDVRQPTVGAMWIDGKLRLRVTGEMPPGTETSFDTPVPDPLALVGGAALEALRRAGIRVAKGVRYAGAAGDRVRGAEVARIENSLRLALRVMNKRSQNLYAEVLFKAAGVEALGSGTWETGEQAVALTFERRGIPTEGMRVVDGSGLSKQNRLSASALARLRLSFDRDVLRGPVLRESLATPGEEGTLSRRFRGVAGRERIRAKTGTLGRSGVFALAGFVDGRAKPEGGRGYAFAIVNNGTQAKGDPRSLEEDIVKELLAE